MRSPSVLIHSDEPAIGREILAREHPGLPVAICDSHHGLAEAIRASEAEVVYSTRFMRDEPFPRAALLGSAGVRWISVGGSGTDHLHSWDPARVTVTNAAGVAADLMAEYILGMMLSFSLGLPVLARAQRAQAWASHQPEPIQGRTLLVLGMGGTGQAIAQRAKAMGMKVLGVRARPAPAASFDEVHAAADLPDLWGRADYIACCLPLTPATRALVDAAAFAAMRATAVLIDVSRGGVVDEGALLAALDGGRLRGAALDVFLTEPLPPGHPFWTHEKVLVTPHCSSADAQWSARSFERFSRNLAAYRRGEALANVVDPQRGY
ncbi:D-2-hydroxyacid dehydrogenase [Ancylobacter amanitiformis]|uniref:Phosphoglycerate dehydrogenase-like enzyme n=1 Tax=Ancylobacter amanitiformis TaxID=217069 RepID=A0ABU0LUB1_9HYPH|nr:D-2-hydroxyacid dehydrogenase [Ancylobacter amanitiformis]MDQ0512275.1 phosphoglycerate dehydrogenase-like enzyme [Ancylobacter amanitiformis]